MDEWLVLTWMVAGAVFLLAYSNNWPARLTSRVTTLFGETTESALPKGEERPEEEESGDASVSIPFTTMEEVGRFLYRESCGQLATCSRQLYAAVEPRLYAYQMSVSGDLMG